MTSQRVRVKLRADWLPAPATYLQTCWVDKHGKVWCPGPRNIHGKKKHSFGVYPEVGDECPICGAVVTEAIFGVGGGR